MKNFTKKNGKQAVSSNQQVDLQNEAVETLKVLLQMDKPYGIRTLVKVLNGDPRVPEILKEIEGFGVYENEKWSTIRNQISQMITTGLIGTDVKSSNIIKATDKGLGFLNEPEPLMVWPSYLKYNKLRSRLEYQVRRIRDVEAYQAGTPSYTILPEFAIDRIIWEYPETMEKLLEIPGISLKVAEKIGPEILEAVADNKRERKEMRDKMMQTTVKSGSYQETKKLFQKGLSIAEIAKKKKVKENTVRQYLENMHRYGEIDLRPWIEENLDSKQLYKGAEYFREAEDPRLKSAYEVLGLDYNILRLCKLYVSDVTTEYVNIAV